MGAILKFPFTSFHRGLFVQARYFPCASSPLSSNYRFVCLLPCETRINIYIERGSKARHALRELNTLLSKIYCEETTGNYRNQPVAASNFFLFLFSFLLFFFFLIILLQSILCVLWKNCILGVSENNTVIYRDKKFWKSMVKRQILRLHRRWSIFLFYKLTVETYISFFLFLISLCWKII